MDGSPLCLVRKSPSIAWLFCGPALAKLEALRLDFGQVVVAIIILAIAFFVAGREIWNRGLRRYSSASS